MYRHFDFVKWFSNHFVNILFKWWKIKIVINRVNKLESRFETEFLNRFYVRNLVFAISKSPLKKWRIQIRCWFNNFLFALSFVSLYFIRWNVTHRIVSVSVWAHVSHNSSWFRKDTQLKKNLVDFPFENSTCYIRLFVIFEL